MEIGLAEEMKRKVRVQNLDGLRVTDNEGREFIYLLTLLVLFHQVLGLSRWVFMKQFAFDNERMSMGGHVMQTFGPSYGPPELFEPNTTCAHMKTAGPPSILQM